MGKLPRINGKALVRILLDRGFKLARIRGSHYRLRHADGRVTTVPVHAGETLGPGLLQKILRDAKLEAKDLTR